MTAIKTYLMKHGVDIGTIVEKEDLLRLLWSTQVDDLESQDLETFMTTNNVPYERCWSFAKKKDAALAAFNGIQAFDLSNLSNNSKQYDHIESNSIDPIKACVVPIFQENEVVVLTGLKKNEMNGKSATIINGSPDANGRIRVKIEHGTGFKEFRVKPENAKRDEEEVLD